MSLDSCNACGAGFLETARQGHSMRVPFFGDIGKISSGQRLAVGIIVTIGLIVLIVVVATIGGKVL